MKIIEILPETKLPPHYENGVTFEESSQFGVVLEEKASSLTSGRIGIYSEDRGAQRND